MVRNYFKIAFRNLWRNRAFSVLNIVGLAIGIATCLVIWLFIQHELSYDRYNKKADRMVRVVFRGTVQGEKMREANVMPPVAQAFKANFPEVEEATRLMVAGYPRIQFGEKTFRDDKLAFVDSNFFKVFTLPLQKGDASTILMQPNSVVLSRAMAKKYFGDADPMGKVVVFPDQKASCTVTGVFDKVPENSHFHFDLFAALSTLQESRELSWMTSGYFTYLVLREGYDYRKLQAKLPAVVDKYIGPQMEKGMGMTLSQFRQKGNDIGLYLEPLTDIHLHSDSTNDIEAGGDIRYVYIFGAIALFMLLIACINFMNLSTAGASKRAKEVGVRKVLGSGRVDLVRQFLLESILLTGAGLLLALGIVYLVLPLFNTLSGKELVFSFGAHPLLLPGLLLFGLLTGVLAGSYPAFFLSSFNPVVVLKGRLSRGGQRAGLRSGLVVFQFFISITLIIATAVVYRQLNYIRNTKLGYDKDQVVVVQETYWLHNNERAYAQEILQDPRVLNVSGSGFLPAGHSDNNNFFVYPGSRLQQVVKTLRYEVDDRYIPTLGMQMASGRNFSKEFGTDSSAAILNETAAAALGWRGDAEGKTITHTDNDGTRASWHVIGVVKDFHFRSMHERISPLVMVLGNGGGNLIVRTRGKELAGLLATMKKEWNDLKGEVPFSYSFLDERFNETYRAEEKTGEILGIFSGLTIFVACLGLFGLATFTAEQRTKEIGIRKVLGASVAGIVTLLAGDFLKLVCVAFFVAGPIAWWVMHKWLEGFAYRVQVGGWVFVFAAGAAVFVTVATIGFRAVRAAVANPVKSLRSE
ncbi:MAG TPA: ABC transporter permease [Puia sp.]|jgi:putative ABC transport system permease protein